MQSMRHIGTSLGVHLEVANKQKLLLRYKINPIVSQLSVATILGFVHFSDLHIFPASKMVMG